MEYEKSNEIGLRTRKFPLAENLRKVKEKLVQTNSQFRKTIWTFLKGFLDFRIKKPLNEEKALVPAIRKD